jgi:hypothetical protein
MMYAKNTTVWQHTVEGEVEVARVVGPYRPLTIRQGQARMFAAAPDMLAALRTIAHIALMDQGQWAKTIEAEALAAINKATEI